MRKSENARKAQTLFPQSIKRHARRPRGLCEFLESRLLLSVQAAAWSDAFVDSVGIMTHANYPEYWNWPAVTTAVNDIGFRKIRGVDAARYETMVNPPKVVGFIWANDSNGYLDPSPAAVGRALQDIKAQYRPQDLFAVEGPNEYDTSSDPNMAANLVAFMREAASQMRQDPWFDNIPLVGPSLNYTLYANGLISDLSDAMDFANLHVYSHDGYWRDNAFGLDREWGRYRWQSDTLPAMVTEQNFALNEVTQTSQGRYFPRMFLQNFSQGIQATIGYQLIGNDWAILNSDFTYRPAATATKNMISILKDPQSSPFIAGSLDFDLLNAPADVKSLLLQKQNGKYYLALWREVSNNGDADYAAAAMSVRFNQNVSSVYSYTPNNSTAATALSVSSNQVNLNISDRAQILEITLSAPPAKPASPTVNVQYLSGAAAKLTWSDVAAETAYIVQRREGHGSLWTPLATLPANATSYTDNTLMPNRNYAYRLLAANSGGGNASAAASVKTPNSSILIDKLNDFSKTSTSAGWQIVSGDYWENLRDYNTASKTSDSSGGLVWHYNNMESFFAKTILQDSSPYTDASTVKFYSSPDGTNWTAVTTTSYRAPNGWNRSTVTLRPANPLPAGTNYLRLDFTGGYTTSRLAEIQIIHGSGVGSGTTSPNQNPVANTDNLKTAKNTPATFDVLINDREYNPGDSLSITAVATPAHGSASISNNKIVYTPATNYTGSDSFTYTLSDGRGGSATGTLNVEIPSLLFDGFEDGNSNGWTTSGGTWSVPFTNRLRTTNMSDWGYKFAYYNDSAAFNWGDMAFQADVSQYSTTNQPTMGILFHHQNDGTQYRLTVSDHDGRERLERVNNWSTTVLAERSGGAYAYFGDHTVVSLRAEIRGNKIRCFRNGVDMFGEITDSAPLTTGTVGVFANGHVGWFDNLAANALVQGPAIGTNFARTTWDSSWQSELSHAQGVTLVGDRMEFADWWAGATHVADRTYTRAAGDGNTYSVTVSSDWATDITSGPCSVGYSINGGAFVYSPTQTPGGSYANVKTTTINVTLDASVTSFVVRRRVTGSFDMVRVFNWADTFNQGSSAPVAPSGLNASAVSSSQINLNWTDNSNNETGFKIERASDAGFTQNLTLLTTTAANVTTYSNTGLNASTTYYYRVRATNGSDSANSNTANATTQSAGASFGASYLKTSWDSTWTNDLSGWQGVYQISTNLEFADWWSSSTHYADRTYTRASGDNATYTLDISSDWATDITSGPCSVGYSINGGAFVYGATQTPGGSYGNLKTTTASVTLDPSVTSVVVRRRVTGAFDMVRLFRWADTFNQVVTGPTLGANFVKTTWDSSWQSELSHAQGVTLVGDRMEFGDWWAGATHVADRTYTRASGDNRTFNVTISSDWATDITGGPCSVGYSINGGAFVYSATQTPGGSYANLKTTTINVTLDASVTSFVVRRRVTGSFDMVRLFRWADTFA